MTRQVWEIVTLWVVTPPQHPSRKDCPRVMTKWAETLSALAFTQRLGVPHLRLRLLLQNLAFRYTDHFLREAERDSDVESVSSSVQIL
jgi:hypothetical protein